MLGQQFTRSGDHSCDKGQISTDHQLFWSLIKSTDDLWSTCDRLEPQSGELSPDPRKYSAKNGFWCNPRSSLIRERCWKSAVSMQLKEFYVGYQCCFPPQYLPCRKYIDFTQTQDFFLCGCDDWNGSFSTTYLPVFCVYLGMLIQGDFSNCSSQFSVPKWKTMGSQSEILFHEILDVQKILVGWIKFFFLAMKFGRNS